MLQAGLRPDAAASRAVLWSVQALRCGSAQVADRASDSRAPNGKGTATRLAGPRTPICVKRACTVQLYFVYSSCT